MGKEGEEGGGSRSRRAMHGNWEQGQAWALLVPGGLMDDNREEQVGGWGGGRRKGFTMCGASRADSLGGEVR